LRGGVSAVAGDVWGWRARGLTQTAALIGIAQPDLSNLLRGQVRGCSVERLMGAVTALGQDIEIRIRPRGDGTRPGRISVTGGGEAG
jgi:hypothetical protein